MTFLYKDFANWKASEYFWLVLAVTVISVANYSGTPLDWITAITNIVCVILVMKGRVSNYVWGLVGVLTYGITSYNAGLYGNASLNLIYYVPMQFYGFYLWQKSKGIEEKVAAKFLNNHQRAIVALVLIIATGAYGSYLETTDDPFPYIDAFTAVGSIVAMWLLVKQYSEQWDIWIAINVLTVYMWIETSSQSGQYAILAMWLVFLGNSIWGKIEWSRKK